MLIPFFVWQRNKGGDRVLKKIDPASVICLIAERNYTTIHLADKTKYLVRSSLSRALKMLPPEIFIQVHRSYAVSVYFIDDITKDHLVIGKTSIPIGREFFPYLMEQLTIIKEDA